MIEARGATPLDPRRDHKNTREVARVIEARGATPLDPRRDHKNIREVAR